MGLIAKAGANTPLVDAGTWNAVCVGYADLGTQYSKEFDSEAQKVMLFWDIPDQRMEWEGESKPRRISNRYTLSLGKKANLRKMLDVWRGRPFTEDELKGFDLSKLIGVGCMLNIAHVPKKDGSGNMAVVQGVMALPRGMPPAIMENDAIRYETMSTTGEFIEPPESLPEWITKIVKESYEYKQAHGIGVGTTVLDKKAAPAPTTTVEDDPVPF
jgi:hypothetical protein